MEQAEKRSYEIGFVTRDAEAISALLESLKRYGAEITLEGPIEQIPLAYKIKKQTQAQFGYVHFLMDPAQIAVVNDELERAEGVLRFLIITPPFMKQKSRMMPQDMNRPAVPHRAAAETLAEKKPAPVSPLSNEALEKKIEEILQQS
ncbi:MAG: 30S ribosomal protein S6 [Candidatus Liptonbacteria bacterium]